MNGEPIPRPYGYPVRCIVPGHAGARNCKYLKEIEITDKPCNGNSNWKQYAVHAPDVPLRKIMEFEKYKKELVVDPPVQEMPVQSMICCNKVNRNGRYVSPSERLHESWKFSFLPSLPPPSLHPPASPPSMKIIPA